MTVAFLIVSPVGAASCSDYRAKIVFNGKGPNMKKPGILLILCLCIIFTTAPALADTARQFAPFDTRSLVGLQLFALKIVEFISATDELEVDLPQELKEDINYSTVTSSGYEIDATIHIKRIRFSRLTIDPFFELQPFVNDNGTLTWEVTLEFGELFVEGDGEATVLMAAGTLVDQVDAEGTVSMTVDSPAIPVNIYIHENPEDSTDAEIEYVVAPDHRSHEAYDGIITVEVDLDDMTLNDFLPVPFPSLINGYVADLLKEKLPDDIVNEFADYSFRYPVRLLWSGLFP